MTHRWPRICALLFGSFFPSINVWLQKALFLHFTQEKLVRSKCSLLTPFSYAISNEPLVHWFLSSGASPNASAPQNARTPVSSACATAPLHIVQLFYVHGASHLDALHSAAESPAEGRLEVLKFLLDDGADVNAVKWAHNEEAYRTWALFGLGTALHYAAKGGYIDRVNLLLSRGAKVNALDSNARTPVEVAREHGQNDVVTILTRHPST